MPTLRVVDANLEIDLAAELGAGCRDADGAPGKAAGVVSCGALVGIIDEAVALVAGAVGATGCERVVLEGARRVPGLDVAELARRLSPVLAADVSIFTREDRLRGEHGDEADGDGADAAGAGGAGARNAGACEPAPLVPLVRGCAGPPGGLAFAGEFSLRIVYAKSDEALALSHRETMREMERCARRAGLPYDVSCGARPHMRTSPGPALPPGCIGQAEPFDVRLRAYVPAGRAREALGRVAPSGIGIVSCAYADVHACGAAQAFPLSDWEARVAGVSARELQAAFDELVEQGFLELKKVRQTKAGPVEKVKRVDFDGRLVAAPEVVAVAGGSAVAEDGSAMEDGAAPPAGKGVAPDDAPEAVGRPQLRCTWTTRDEGNGALRADLFAAEVLSRLPGARLVSLARTGLRSER